MRLGSELDALFDNLKLFSRSENFIGQPVKVDDITLIPILSLSFGAGGGAADGRGTKGSGGGAGGKISPISIVITQGDDIKLFSLNGQNSLKEITELIPEIISMLKTPDNNV